MRNTTSMMRKVHFSRRGDRSHLGHLVLVPLFGRCGRGLLFCVNITLPSTAHSAELRGDVIACRETEHGRQIQYALRPDRHRRASLAPSDRLLPRVEAGLGQASSRGRKPSSSQQRQLWV